MENIIQATITNTAPIDMYQSFVVIFVVTVVAPLVLKPKIYHVSMVEMLKRRTSEKEMYMWLLTELEGRLLRDYNKIIEESPLLDMIDFPEQYQRATGILWVQISLMGRAGLEPATRISSGYRSTN